MSASSFFSFQFALNIILLLSQGRGRLAEGQECLSKETNETGGNYEAGRQNQRGLQTGAPFPGFPGDGGTLVELQATATQRKGKSRQSGCIRTLLSSSFLITSSTSRTLILLTCLLK